MRNKEIHEAFFKSGVKKWIAAEKLGISDVAFSKKLRKELSKEEKEMILKVIKEVQSESEVR